MRMRWISVAVAVVAVVVVAVTAGCGAGTSGGALAPASAPSTSATAPEAGSSTSTTRGSAPPSTSTTAAGSAPRPIAGVPGSAVAVKPAVAPKGRASDASLVTADGRTRTYHLYVPSSVASSPAGTEVPLLVALHGGLGSGTQFERNSGYDGLAEANGFIVVYPDGFDGGTGALPIRTWNGGACCGPAVRQQVDDVGFIRQLIGVIEQDQPIDRSHVVVTGHSNGGILAFRLACELSDQIAAIGVQSTALEVDSCAPSHPVSVLQIHGTADANIPIGGGNGSKAVSGVAFNPPEEASKTLAAADGCPAQPSEAKVAANADLTVTSWTPCDAGTEVAFVRVEGASHAWMGHPTGGSGLVGPVYPDLDSSFVIWNFLSQHGRS